MTDTQHLHALGMELVRSDDDGDTRVWRGHVPTSGPGPYIGVGIESRQYIAGGIESCQWWQPLSQEWHTHYAVTLSVGPVSVQSDWHDDIMDAYDEARDQAHAWSERMYRLIVARENAVSEERMNEAARHTGDEEMPI